MVWNLNLIYISPNIFISAMIFKTSTLRLVLEKAFSDYVVYVSEETLTEFLEVANRPKFLKYFENNSEKEDFINFVTSSIKIIKVAFTVTDCQDPKDNKFLEIALSCNALYLVTGDKKDLLSMNPYRGVNIITAREFLEL